MALARILLFFMLLIQATAAATVLKLEPQVFAVWIHSVKGTKGLELFTPALCEEYYKLKVDNAHKLYDVLKTKKFQGCWAPDNRPFEVADGYKIFPSPLELKNLNKRAASLIFYKGKKLLHFSLLGLAGWQDGNDKNSLIKSSGAEIHGSDLVQICKRSSKACSTTKLTFKGPPEFYFSPSVKLTKAGKLLKNYFQGEMNATEAAKLLKKNNMQSLLPMLKIVESGDYVCRNRVISEFKARVSMDQGELEITGAVVVCPQELDQL